MSQKLTRLEALIATIKEGKKIRRPNWKTTEYIYLDDAKDLFIDEKGNHADQDDTPACNYHSSEVWELYEEPKRNEKFVGYEYRYINERGHFCCAKEDRNWEVVSKDKPYWQHLETIEHHYEKINGKWEKVK